VKKCPNTEKDMEFCSCTYEPCSRKGTCCECVRYHREMSQLPACFFSAGAEKSYDRSFRKFISENK